MSGKKERAVFAVSTVPPTDSAALEFLAPETSPGNAFFGWSEPADSVATDNETIQAVIHEGLLVHTGSYVKIRLLQDIFIASSKITRGSFLTGRCSIDGERINIQISSLNYNNHIYPIALKVYDTDGLEGLPAPGAMSRDAAKEGLSQGISSMNMAALDPSIAGQATAASIETAKSLLSRKMKLVQAMVNANHKILLKRS